MGDHAELPEWLRASATIRRSAHGFSAYEDNDDSRLIASSDSIDDLERYLREDLQVKSIERDWE